MTGPSADMIIDMQNTQTTMFARTLALALSDGRRYLPIARSEILPTTNVMSSMTTTQATMYVGIV